jgi:4-aminobutyrate aminotransferase-like enzyme
MSALQDALNPSKFTTAEILELEKQFMVPAIVHYYREPRVMVRGEGATLIDNEGKTYIDLFAGVCTTLAGHCHPVMTTALKKQLDTLMHTTTLYPTVPMALYAKRLVSIMPSGSELTKCFFVNSGSEANEAAMLLAKKYKGTNFVLALNESFHGRTLMSMSITNQGVWRQNIAYAPGAIGVSNAYCYRCDFGQREGECDLECARFIEKVIRCQTPNRIAALIAEPIQGNGGVIVPPQEYFKLVVDIVHNYDGLFISDEVQTGFGRTGDKLWGIEHWGVTPDIITLAKGIASGFPLGAFVTRTDIANCLRPKDLFATYGGNPMAMIAGLANLEIIEREQFVRKATEKGKQFRKGLEELMEKYKLIGDVRGRGLMLGFELVKDRVSKRPAIEETDKIMNLAFEKGLLLGLGGMSSNVIRIKPPLVISGEEIDRALTILAEVLQVVS